MSDIYVIIDDRDTSISYYPTTPNEEGPMENGWMYGGTSIEFMSTTMYTGYTPSTMSLKFNGTSIMVYGTLSAFVTSTFNFTVDGAHTYIMDRNTTSHEFHQQVYWSGNLDDGEHLLEVTVTDPLDTGGSSCFIDYIMYTPSQNASLNNENPYLFIDDTSPYIHYSSSGWARNTPSSFNSDSFMSYNNSINMASSVGAQATVYFQGNAFRSTVLEAWGAIPIKPDQTAIASYTIDNGTSKTINIPASTPSTSKNIDNNLAWNYPLFNEAINGDGVHTLNLIALQPNLLYLDFFLVSSPVAFIPTGNSTINSPPPLLSQKNSSHTSAIIGGTIGGVIIIALISIGFFFHRRKRQAGEFDPPDPTRVNYGEVMNTYRGANELPHTSNHLITDVNTDTTSIAFGAGQAPYGGPMSPNNQSDSPSHTVPPYNYDEGERRLSQANGNIGRPPMQMENMIRSSWPPPTSAPVTGAMLGSTPLQPIPNDLDEEKIPIPPNNGMREHESTIQERDSGYRDPINSVFTAPPSYTFE